MVKVNSKLVRSKEGDIGVFLINFDVKFSKILMT